MTPQEKELKRIEKLQKEAAKKDIGNDANRHADKDESSRA